MNIAAILALLSAGIELVQKLNTDGRADASPEEIKAMLAASNVNLESAYNSLYPGSPLPGPSDADEPKAPPPAIQL